MKKWILRLSLLITIIVLAAVIYIEVNKEQLVATTISKINENIDGTITYSRVNISILRSFPSLRIGLDSLSIDSEFDRNESRLFTSNRVSADVDLLSVIRDRKDISINSVIIDQSFLHLEEYQDGTNNYSITNNNESNSTRASDLNIEQIHIHGSKIQYVNLEEGNTFDLKNTDLKGSLTLINNEVILKSTLSSNVLLNFESLIPNYNFVLNINSEIKISENLDTFRLSSGLLSINDLPIEIEGLFSTYNQNFTYSFDFNSPETDFINLISALPIYYKNNYGALVSDGSYTLRGAMSGSSQEAYPKYEVELKTLNGVIAYPDLPHKLHNVTFQLNAENKATNTLYDNFQLTDLNAQMGSSYVRGRIEAKHENSHEILAHDLSMNINLKNVQDGIKATSVDNMKGTVMGTVKGTTTFDSKKQSILNSNLLVDLKLNQITFDANNRTFSINTGVISGGQSNIALEINGANYAKAIDFDLSGQIKNIVENILLEEANIEGNILVNAGTIDLNKLNEQGLPEGGTEINIPNTSLSVDFNAEKIIHSNHTLNDVQAHGFLTDKSSNFKFLISEFNGSRMDGEGILENVLQYGLNGDTLTGNLKVVSDALNLDEFMMDPESPGTPITNSDLIPDNIELDIDYESGNINFKNFKIIKSLGVLSIKDNKIVTRNNGSIFDGNIKFRGTFDTDLPDGYHLDFNIELNELSFQKTASETKLFSEIIPIAKFLEGNYTATLNWNSKLNNNYIPDLNSLSAIGTIETKNGVIKGTLPIDSFINKFTKINEPGGIRIMDTKNYFVIENGGVVLDEINFQKGDIKVHMSGTHGFDQSLNYQLTIDIPGNKINADEILGFVKDKFMFSDQLKSATNNLELQLIALMSGTIVNPKFSIQKVNLKRGSQVENISETAKTTVEATVDTLINKVEDTIRATTSVVTAKVDSAKEELKEQLDSSITSLEDLISGRKNEGQVLLDSLKSGNPDSIKSRIEDLFKNKKGAIDSLKLKLPGKSLLRKKKKN